jgi:hypothetical protein
MGTLRSGSLGLAAVLSFCFISGCGGHSSGGTSPYPARITLNPPVSTSVQLGTIFTFTATAQNSSNSNVSTSFTFSSSNTSILNLAPNGVACAGHWDAAYTTCSPGGVGVATVTAEAFGATSAPTYVFVHPPVDNIRVTGVLLNGVPVQEPCLAQGQSMTVEAHAFSQGSDITSSVGPFTWSADNSTVVKLTPFTNPAASPFYPFATNQATATATTPGLTQIYATASGVTSNTFYQPQYQNPQGVTSPPLDFFETCLIQNITLELGHLGSQQTTFTATKGTAQTVFATVTDVMGNTSLPSSNSPVVLSNIPLTWTASQPAAVAPATGCHLSCALSTPSPGAGAITASCSPPTCNIGFPEVPQALVPGSPAAAQCAAFFQLASCQQFIPLPVYSSPPVVTSPPSPVTPAISGLVTGTVATTTVLATSGGCQSTHPLDCSTAIYNVATSRPVVSGATLLPSSPNSLFYDLAGDKAYMGSEVRAIAITPSNLGTSTNAFTSVGAATGKVLAVSNDGNMALFSDTTLSPNQVFVVNSTQATVALNITNASVGAITPDNLKAYIFGFDSTGLPNLYIYSSIQALQKIPLTPGTTVHSIAFSTNGAFAYVVEATATGNSFTVYNTCDNQISTDVHGGGTQQIIPLTAPPVSFKALPDGQHFIALENNGTFDYFTATVTGIPAATPTAFASYICPMTVTHAVPPPSNINLGQGAFQALDFFPAPDGTMLYILAADRPSVLVYNFGTGATTGIELINNAIPVSGSMSADGGTIVIAGSDGKLHEVSTTLGGSDMSPPLVFPDLPNYLNPFCTGTPSSGPCSLNLVALKP